MHTLILISLLAFAFQEDGALDESAAPTAEARLLDGRTTQGAINELSAEQVVVNVEGAVAAHPTAALHEIVFSASAPAPPALEQPIYVKLVDGARLLARDYRVEQGAARMTLAAGQSVVLPTKSIATVRFREQSPQLARQWAAYVASRASADLLVIRKQDALDFLEGVLRDTIDDDGAMEFELGGDLLPVKRSRIEGLIYYHSAGRVLPPAQCVVVDRAGQRVPVAEFQFADGRFEATSPAGLRLAWDSANLARLDFSAGKIVYLGDIEPKSWRWTPYFGSADDSPELAEFRRPRENRGWGGETLLVGGAAYEKGLALHSRTEITYQLPGSFRAFEAIVGIDDRAGDRGDVRLVIQGDGRVLSEAKITGRDAPLELEVDVAGVSELTILADFGDDQDIGDHLNLCEARVVK